MFYYVCGKYEAKKRRRAYSGHEDKYKSLFSLQVTSGQ